MQHVGAGLGAASGSAHDFFGGSSRGLTALIGIVIGAPSGAIVGAVLPAHKTVYRVTPVVAQQVPQPPQPPANEKLLLQVHAKGDQIYTCKNDGSQLTWTLKAPDAQLFDKDGKSFGKHFAGPTWEANDGSRISGQSRCQFTFA